MFHTSPNLITEISSIGLFDDGLFFANKPYFMSISDEAFVYEIDERELNIIEAKSIFYCEKSKLTASVVKHVQKIYALSKQDAMDFIDGTMNVYNKSWNADMGDVSFDAQLFALRAAKAMGYDGVELQDEQGTAYLISMKDKLNMLRLTDYPPGTPSPEPIQFKKDAQRKLLCL